MRLYFLRHGIAQDHSPNLLDAQRALVPEGTRKIERLVERLPSWDVKPHVIYSSPLVRAHQTAAIVAARLNAPLKIVDALDLNFNPLKLQNLVDQQGVGQTSDELEVMLVGHEPSFSSVISYLIGGGNITMKKGSLARVDLFSQHPLHGTLVWLIPPKLLG